MVAKFSAFNLQLRVESLRTYRCSHILSWSIIKHIKLL